MTHESFCVNCQCATKGKKSANCCAYCMTKGFSSNYLFTLLQNMPWSLYLHFTSHSSVYTLSISPSSASSPSPFLYLHRTRYLYVSGSPFLLCFACCSRLDLAYLCCFTLSGNGNTLNLRRQQINRQKILDRRSTRPMQNI
jgi:hypothetical protein